MLRVLFVAVLIVAAPARAQEATVRGFAEGAGNGNPLQGVNVTLVQGKPTSYGTATDTDGFYSISGVPAGKYVLRATYLGYKTRNDTLRLSPGEVLEHNFTLQSANLELEEVEVATEREAAGLADVTAGLQTVKPEDIERIPMPDVSGDLANYLRTLPGVVSTGDRGGQLYVRGGEPTQNLIMLDGMAIYQPFHLVGFYSAFPSSIIKSADVYAGGYGAQYGGWLSSVIDISARNGNKRQFAGAVSLAPFVSGVRLEGPIWKNRVSVLLSRRESLIEQGASRLVDQPLPFDFGDQFAKIHAKLTANSRLSVSGLRTHDRGIIGKQQAPDSLRDQQEVSWKNEAFSARFLLLPSSLPMRAEIIMSSSRVENEFGLEDRSRSSLTRQYKTAVNATYFTQNVDMKWGLSVRTSRLKSSLGGQFQNVETDEEYITEAAAYLEPRFVFSGQFAGLSVQPGVRFQTFPSKSKAFVEPRLRAVWDFDTYRLSAAAGLYHQEIVGLNDRRDVGNVFTAWTSSPLGRVPSALHLIGGYQVEPAPWLKLSLEGYYKRLSNLYIARWSAFPSFTTELQPADGRAYGFDLRAEGSWGPFYGSMSYGFSRVTYDAQQASLQFWFGEREKRFSPPHDRRHQVSVQASLDLLGATLNVHWRFGSGLPYSQALGFDEFVLVNGPIDPTKKAGSTRVLYQEPYNGRLPAYHRLDISLRRSVQLYGRARANFQASLINAYDRRNIFYLDLFTLRRADQLPLLPSLGVQVEIK